jgi:nucleoid DNA-binding protein
VTFRQIAKALLSGRRVLIQKFGSFQVKEKTDRVMWCEALKATRLVPKHKVVKFNISQGLRKKIWES